MTVYQSKTKELRANKNAIIDKMTAIIEGAEKEERNLNPAEKKEYDELTAQVNDLDATIKRHLDLDAAIVNDAAQVRTIANNGSNTNTTGPAIEFRTADGKSVKGYTKGARISEGDNNNAGRFIRSIFTGKTDDLNEAEKRALAAGSGSGSYTVPTKLAAQVIDKLRANLVFDQAGAVTIPIDGPTKLVSVTGDPTCEWHVENASLTASDPTFSPISLDPKWITCLVKVSRENVEQALNLEQALEMALIGAIKNTLEAGILSGTGSSGQITGMDNWSGNINSFALGENGDTLSGYEDLLYADYLLRSDNSQMNAAIMSPRTHRDLSMLTDTTGQPLQLPESLKSARFLSTANVADDFTQGSASENTSRIYAGDFSKLFMGMLSNIRIELLRETFAGNFQYGFLAWMAVDVQPVHEQAFALVKGIKESSFTNTYV